MTRDEKIEKCVEFLMENDKDQLVAIIPSWFMEYQDEIGRGVVNIAYNEALAYKRLQDLLGGR